VHRFLLRPLGVAADDGRWRGQVAGLQHDVTRWTGNDARVLEVGLDEIATLLQWDSVLDDVLRDAIPLTGDATALRRAMRSLRP
jgi:hypothetical protein